MQQKGIKKFIGNKAFYKTLLVVIIPIIIQTGITNFVGLLDNLMVGQIGTEQMSGVAIANQLIFIFNLCIFGATAGAGIFGAQFYGNHDFEGVRNAFRFKLYACVGLVAIASTLFLVFGEQLVSLYLSGGDDPASTQATMGYAVEYLHIMTIGFFPFSIAQAYSGTLRESSETVLPMKAGVVAVFVNLGLNYLLIFGNLGFPQWGSRGAAIATVIARFIECFIILWVVHHKKTAFPYFVGAYRTLKIPTTLVKSIIIRGMPLLLNEFLWSFAMATLMGCYSVRGLSVVAGLNIASTVANLFNVVYLSMGNAVGILVGQHLGAGELEKAKDTDNKLLFFATTSCLVVGVIMALFAPMIPNLYNTSEEVRGLATQFLWVSAAYMPIGGFLHSCYFTLRAGGRTGITFVYDCVYIWVVNVVLAFILTRFTDLPIVTIYFICQFADIFKCLLGLILLKKGIWIQNIIEEAPNDKKQPVVISS